MNTRMPVGISDFKKMREQYYFIDKTDFIRHFLQNHADITLFTRPRRFGKTVTMSMLDYFFSIEKKDIGQELFSGLAIEKAGQDYMSHQGKYPVIFMSLKGIQQSTWSQMYEGLTFFIRKEYEKHDYLWTSGHLKDSEKSYCQRIVAGTAQPVEYQVSLLQLTEFLARFHKQPPIILIDEYDVPLHAAFEHGFYEEAMEFFKLWFMNTLKDNPFLQFAVLTGVLRIAKESIFSGLNNLDVYSVLDAPYSQVFGFTKTEVTKLTTDMDIAKKLPELKTWYDGYTVGQTEIYNPWSVLKYVANDCQPAPYWISTSDNGILRHLLQHAPLEQIESLETLLRGQPITTSVDDTLVYRSLPLAKSALYTLLLTTGYLTVVNKIPYTDDRYALRIPNEEIKRVYRKEILNTIAAGLDMDTFETIFDSLVTGQAERFEAQLQHIISHFVSAYDTANKESFYHGFMLGMIALFLNKAYTIESNRESGYGLFDVALFPRHSQQAGIIMEFKAAPSLDQLSQSATKALQQIDRNAYIAEFQKRHIPIVWKYGIAFYGKHVKLCSSFTTKA